MTKLPGIIATRMRTEKSCERDQDAPGGTIVLRLAVGFQRPSRVFPSHTKKRDLVKVLGLLTQRRTVYCYKNGCAGSVLSCSAAS